MFEHIKKQYGAVDICVNNAGLAIPAPLLSGETSAWKNAFDVSLLTLILVMTDYCFHNQGFLFPLCSYIGIHASVWVFF